MKTEHKIVRSNEDEFTKWDVDDRGYVQNETGKPLDDVQKFLEAEIEKAGIDLKEYDYFSTMKYERKTWPALYRRVFAFACPGGSEGHYIHLDMQTMDGAIETIFLGKSFMGLDHALELSNCLSRILDENYR
jgi:hypothetical protein